MPSYLDKSIVRYKRNSIRKEDDRLAIEAPLQISLKIGDSKAKDISITMRTPGDDSELAIGFLYTEGILNADTTIQDIMEADNEIVVHLKDDQDIDLSSLERHFYTSSSCGVCGKASIDAIKTERPHYDLKNNLRFTAEQIISFPEKLRHTQVAFDSTGGIHAAGLFDTDGSLVMLKEDVGRHNALDKLIGWAYMENKMPLDTYAILLSGRASFELIQKAAMAGCQMILAVGAPSTLAVELAEEYHMTLVGFLRDERFNIYSGADRLDL